jgi:hypothetical protein
LHLQGKQTVILYCPKTNEVASGTNLFEFKVSTNFLR